jgi:hypothetical protein
VKIAVDALNGESPCCIFVTNRCSDTNGNVISLDFTSITGAGGVISPAITALTKLNFIEAGGAGFAGELPSFLGQLTALTYLSFSGNSFSGTRFLVRVVHDDVAPCMQALCRLSSQS